MLKAVFLDFYGTVVYEDGVIVKIISERIFNTGKAADTSRIAHYWWKEFQELCLNSYGETFRTQRALEYQSIINTLNFFQSTENADELCALMFERWEKPPIFEDAAEFFKRCPVPIHIVSNIDDNDIMKAIKLHGLKPSRIFTSEAARAYKPKAEIFEMALKDTGLLPEEVVHIGDSFSSDVRGAKSAGINAVWLNRNQKTTPEEVCEVQDLLQAFETEYFKYRETC